MNTFENLEKFEDQKAATNQPVSVPGEVSFDALSDTAIGEKVKYTRPDLDGKDDVIDKVQIFTPNTEDEPQKAQTGTTQYWKVSVLLSYESENEDGVQNREYLSGARAFKQDNGGVSEISFWYSGATSQVALLWEKVAKQLKKEPDQLSPRDFAVFLNSKPKVTLKGEEFKNFAAPPGAPKTVTKNMVGGFLN